MDCRTTPSPGHRHARKFMQSAMKTSKASEIIFSAAWHGLRLIRSSFGVRYSVFTPAKLSKRHRAYNHEQSDRTALNKRSNHHRPGTVTFALCFRIEIQLRVCDIPVSLHGRHFIIQSCCCTTCHVNRNTCNFARHIR